MVGTSTLKCIFNIFTTHSDLNLFSYKHLNVIFFILLLFPLMLFFQFFFSNLKKPHTLTPPTYITRISLSDIFLDRQFPRKFLPKIRKCSTHHMWALLRQVCPKSLCWQWQSTGCSMIWSSAQVLQNLELISQRAPISCKLLCKGMEAVVDLFQADVKSDWAFLSIKLILGFQIPLTGNAAVDHF